MVDFVNITELPRAAVDNIPRFEATVKEQVGQSLLTNTEKLPLEAFPDLGAGSHVFKERLSWKNRQLY